MKKKQIKFSEEDRSRLIFYIGWELYFITGKASKENAYKLAMIAVNAMREAVL